jgi:hypothetical protein
MQSKNKIMWLYENKEIKEITDMPNSTFGFIYEVTHLPTGRKYLGKKQLMSVTNKALGKKELALLTDKRSSKKKQVIKESDWKTYYGSQSEIKQLIKEGKKEDFKREILCFVATKKLLTYYETKYLFVNEVLEKDDQYINDNILGKFFRKDLDTIK